MGGTFCHGCHSQSFFCPSPAASSISSESSPVSSPATNHSSPVSTPKRGPLGPGPVLVPPVGHSVPNTPPVVTIAPTKTSNGLWRNEGRQVRPAQRHSSSPPPQTLCLLCIVFSRLKSTKSIHCLCCRPEKQR